MMLLRLLAMLSSVALVAGQWSCETNVHIQATYRPGTVTVDGRSEDWDSVPGHIFSPAPALSPDWKEAYDGDMVLKVLHDGSDIFFLVQFDGDFAYSQGHDKKCPSVALMFKVGDNASYYNMGGCDESSSCSSKTCWGHEVDIVHFSIGYAVPGRLYGDPSSEQLVDMLAYSPDCKFLDQVDHSALNEWRGSWWHSSLRVHSGFREADSPYGSIGRKGTFQYELTRPLGTTDEMKQDVQFVIGQSRKMAVAFWYPSHGRPWHGHDHFSATCDWILLDILGAPKTSRTISRKTTFLVILAFFFTLIYCLAFGYLSSERWIFRFRSISDH